MYEICKFTSAVAYIYRDERRLVEPPTVIMDYSKGLHASVESKRPTPGFGLSWSLNQQDPTVRCNTEFGIKEQDLCKDTVTYYTHHTMYSIVLALIF